MYDAIGEGKADPFEKNTEFLGFAFSLSLFPPLSLSNTPSLSLCLALIPLFPPFLLFYFSRLCPGCQSGTRSVCNDGRDPCTSRRILHPSDLLGGTLPRFWE